MGRKTLKTCFDHTALEISHAVNVTAALLRAVAYRFVFNEGPACGPLVCLRNTYSSVVTRRLLSRIPVVLRASPP